jgi:hypothetical protein
MAWLQLQSAALNPQGKSEAQTRNFVNLWLGDKGVSQIECELI